MTNKTLEGRKCAYCSKHYLPETSGAIRENSFCSDSCEHRYYEAREGYQS